MAGNDWNWVDLVNLGLAGYQTYKNTRGPDFKNPGLTPEQQQLYQLFFKSLTNPALANNAGDTSNYARSILGGYSNLGWQSPKTHNGETGYQGHAPVNFDWSKLGGAPTSTPPPTGTAPGNMSGPTASPSPISGDPFGHLSAPAGSSGDPFAGLPSGITGGGNSQSGGGITAFLDQHPNLFRNGAGAAATLLASMLGVPPMIASGLVNMYMRSKNGGGDPNDPLAGKPLDTRKGHAYDSYDPEYSSENFLLNDNVPKREPWQGPYTGTTEPTPSATTGLPGGSYNAMYGGDGGNGPDLDTRRMIRQSLLRGQLGFGQRV